MARCLKKSLSAMKTFSKSAQIRNISWSAASKALAVPEPDGQPKLFSPKIEEIANTIAQLNLVEVAELSELLKKKLKLPDAPAVSFAGIAAAPAAPKEEEEVQNVQTLFGVKLVKFDEKQKVALIKEIKNLLEGMNLVQVNPSLTSYSAYVKTSQQNSLTREYEQYHTPAKKFVESAPVFVKQDIGKDEAEKLKEALIKAGGEVEIV